MKRTLRIMIALAFCAAAQTAFAQGDDDEFLDDPEAGFTDGPGDDGSAAGGEGDAAEAPETPPDADADAEVAVDSGALITLRHFQAGANLGYDVSLESGPIEAFGLALGLHFGVTLESDIHVGLFFTYHLGETSEGDIPVPADFGPDNEVHIEKTWAYHFYGIKIGYEHALMQHVVVRPLGVLGVQAATVEECTDGSCESGLINDFLFGLGGELLYLGDGFYVGPELRWNISLGDPWVNSLSMLLGGGITF